MASFCYLTIALAFKRQPHKIVKPTQTIRRHQPTNCLSVCDNFVGLKFKELRLRSHTQSIANQCSLLLPCEGFYKGKIAVTFLFNRVAGLRACNFIKKRRQRRCFPVKYAKFQGHFFFLQSTPRWLLPNMEERIQTENSCICIVRKSQLRG